MVSELEESYRSKENETPGQVYDNIGVDIQFQENLQYVTQYGVIITNKD